MATLFPGRTIFSLLSIGLLLAAAGDSINGSRPLDAARKSNCAAPEYRQFDFWLGDWDAFEIAEPQKALAHAKIEKILGGCVVLEDYQQADGVHGQSFSIYDASRKVWHQTWVTNGGRLLMIEGGLQPGEMVLSGDNVTSDGKKRMVRGVWKAVSGGVRETAVTSTDGGKTWQPWFDMIFHPHRL